MYMYMNTEYIIQSFLPADNAVTFHAHKCMLMSASAVFSAMFTHDFAEKVRGVVEVSDVESNVFNQMLR